MITKRVIGRTIMFKTTQPIAAAALLALPLLVGCGQAASPKATVNSQPQAEADNASNVTDRTETIEIKLPESPVLAEIETAMAKVPEPQSIQQHVELLSTAFNDARKEMMSKKLAPGDAEVSDVFRKQFYENDQFRKLEAMVLQWEGSKWLTEAEQETVAEVSQMLETARSENAPPPVTDLGELLRTVDSRRGEWSSILEKYRGLRESIETSADLTGEELDAAVDAFRQELDGQNNEASSALLDEVKEVYEAAKSSVGKKNASDQ